jgi:hypothetical protein
MNKIANSLILILFLFTACGPATPTATPTLEITATITSSPTPLPPTLTPTPEPTAIPAYPPEGIGPDTFPQNVDPLTGLVPPDPSLLDRRPLMVKVSNIPRYVRPQWGLSLADHVYEYYTEYGSTRYIAIYLGQDASQVGPIRSARFFDDNIIRAYKAIFTFGYADFRVMDKLFSADYAKRLVLESENTPLFRYDPNGYNHLMIDTSELSKYINSKGVDNTRQDLHGMFFKMEAPANGQLVQQIFVHYSNAIYNKWEFDVSTGKYLRSSDTVDAERATTEVYAPLTDALTNKPVTAANVVFLEIPYQFVNKNPEQFEIPFIGEGKAYAFRDGQGYDVRWLRMTQDAMVSLKNIDGTPFAFKPGNTFFEVIGTTSTLTQDEQGWRFVFHIP